jgi:hypothetical protein
MSKRDGTSDTSGSRPHVPEVFDPQWTRPLFETGS